MICALVVCLPFAVVDIGVFFPYIVWAETTCWSLVIFPAEGVVAVGFVAKVCLMEREENVVVLVDLDLVELIALVRPSVYNVYRSEGIGGGGTGLWRVGSMLATGVMKVR